jgi:hypothetical protein
VRVNRQPCEGAHDVNPQHRKTAKNKNKYKAAIRTTGSLISSKHHNKLSYATLRKKRLVKYLHIKAIDSPENRKIKTEIRGHTGGRKRHQAAAAPSLPPSRDERKTGIPMGPTGPMGFPWEWEWESELDGNGDGNGNDSTGMGGNGNRTVPVKR